MDCRSKMIDAMTRSRNLIASALVLLGTTLGAGCMGHATLSTGRALPRGDIEVGVAAESGKEPDAGISEDGGAPHHGSDDITVYPWMRFGLGHNLDLGIKWMGLGGMADLKYQFVGDSESDFALALDLSGGHVQPYASNPKSWGSGTTGISEAYGFTEGALTVIGSYRFLKIAELYLAPKSALRVDRFVHKEVTSSDPIEIEQANIQSTLLGLGGGLKLDFARLFTSGHGLFLLGEVQHLWRVQGDPLPSNQKNSYLSYNLGLGYTF